jgi:hypothetical protein
MAAIMAAIMALSVRSSAIMAASCTKYAVPVDAWPSGNGKLWEYYHLMVDFVPAIYHHMGNNPTRCKHLYVPGWYKDYKFYLTHPQYPRRSMEDKFNYFLGRPFNIKLIPIANKKTMEVLVKRTDVNVIPWNCHANNTAWSNQPDVYFTGFRNYAVSMLGKQQPVRSDIVVVKRKAISNYSGPPTGAQRRKLSSDFFRQLNEDMRHTKAIMNTESLENATTEHQVKVFSKAAAVVAIHGAALSNMLFSPPGTLIVEVGKRLVPCYPTLAKKLQLDYFYHPSTTYSPLIGKALKTRLARKKRNPRFAD